MDHSQTSTEDLDGTTDTEELSYGTDQSEDSSLPYFEVPECDDSHHKGANQCRATLNTPNMYSAEGFAKKIDKAKPYWIAPGQMTVPCNRACTNVKSMSQTHDWIMVVATHGTDVYEDTQYPYRAHLCEFIRNANPRDRPLIDLNEIVFYPRWIRCAILADAVIPTGAKGEEQKHIDVFLRHMHQPTVYKTTEAGILLHKNKYSDLVCIYDGTYEQERKKQRIENRNAHLNVHLVFDLVCIYLLTETKFNQTPNLFGEYISEYIPWSMISRHMDEAMFFQYNHDWISAMHIGGFNILRKYNSWFEWDDEEFWVLPEVGTLAHYAINYAPKFIFAVDLQVADYWRKKRFQQNGGPTPANSPFYGF